MVDKTHERESSTEQKHRVLRALDVAAVKKMNESSKDDPIFTIPVKILTSNAEANYATMMDIGLHYHVDRHGGIKYVRNTGKYKVKAKTWLNCRNKLDRVEKIKENPEDHIFEKGGVSP